MRAPWDWCRAFGRNGAATGGGSKVGIGRLNDLANAGTVMAQMVAVQNHSEDISVDATTLPKNSYPITSPKKLAEFSDCERTALVIVRP